MYSLGVLIGGHKSGSVHSDYPSCFDHSKEGRGGPDAIQLPPDPCQGWIATPNGSMRVDPAVFRLNAAERERS